MKSNITSLLAAAILLMGCKNITTTATIYQGKNHMERGSIVALFEKDSLENKTIADYILTKLAENGFTPTETDENAEFTVEAKYKITENKSKHLGDLYFLFEHTIQIDIYKLNADSKKDKQYELKAVYTGKCGNINPQIKMRMIDSIFLDFPGKNGQSKRRRLNINRGESDQLLNPC